MSWRDFLYFSKGERSGLIVLLCLMTIAGILLILNNKQTSVIDTEIKNTSTGNVREQSYEPSTQQPSQVNNLNENEKSKSTNISKQSSSSDKPKNRKTESESIVPSSTDLKSSSENKKESVSERVQRLTSFSQPSYSRVEKFKEGTVVELNTADTTILKKVPGIGSAFAKRIVGYRTLLGGYYSVTQLSEVYGIDEEKYNALVPWFRADPSYISQLEVNSLPQDSLRRHPYINYNQAKIISQIRKQKGKISGWENLQLLNEFADEDKVRLQHYLSFE